jgi:hypothetical protein
MAKKRDLRYRSAHEFLDDLGVLKTQLSRGMSHSDIARFVSDVRAAEPSSNGLSTGERDSIDIPVDFSETGTGQQVAASEHTPTDLLRESIDIVIDDVPPSDYQNAALEQFEPRRSSPLSRKTKAGSDYDEASDTIVDSTGSLLSEILAQMPEHERQAHGLAAGSAHPSSGAAELRRYDFDDDDEPLRLPRPGDTVRPANGAAGRYVVVQGEGTNGPGGKLDSVAPEDVVEVTTSDPPPAPAAVKPKAVPSAFARIEPTRVTRSAANSPSPRTTVTPNSASKVPRPPTAAAPVNRSKPAIAPPRPFTSDADDDEETRLYSSSPIRAGLVSVDLSGHGGATEPAPAPADASPAIAIPAAPRPPGKTKF